VIATFKPTPAKIRKLRKQLGLSLAAFALEVGVTSPTVGNWEKKTGTLNIRPAPLEQLTRIHKKSLKNKN
jgi:DNA-binding transcriptional regulator YiaG